jgi:hypothetical protein
VVTGLKKKKKKTEILIDSSKEIENKCRENQVYVAISSLECRSNSGQKNSKHRLKMCRS